MTPRLRADVSTTTTDYGTILLDEQSSRYWQLTPTAAVVLEALQAGEGVAGAVRRLTDRYPVTAETATRDATALLRQLADIGVVAS